jgi:hypothetical protein
MGVDGSTELPPFFKALTDVAWLTGDSSLVAFTNQQRQLVVDAALALIAEVYVHLPLKRAIHAIDPERRLRLLQLRIAEDLDAEQARQRAHGRGRRLVKSGPEQLHSNGLDGIGLQALLYPRRSARGRPGRDALKEIGLEALLQQPPRISDVAGRGPTTLEELGLGELVTAEAPPAVAKDRLSDRDFHGELFEAFRALQDLHTRYISPDPVRRRMAFLPMLIEECWERDAYGRLERRYIVSKVSLEHPPDAVDLLDATVTHWNGVPIELAVQRRAEQSHGANHEAQHARGVESLTARWLGTAPPPDEEWVIVNYHGRRYGAQEARLRWLVGTIPRLPDAKDDSRSRRATSLGLDPQSEMRRRLKYRLFTRAGAGEVAKAPQDEPWFDRIMTPSGPVGYLRIHTFAVDDVDTFICRIRNGLRWVPARGLVIDVRGNPGGDILASERLLALLCARPEPQLLQFRITPTTYRVAESLGAEVGPRSASVIGSIKSGLRSGALYSGGSEVGDIEWPDEPAYSGPIVLIIDALCYSATEVFAAGLQDNRRGRILGTALRTGGGAGNSWGYEVLQLFDRQERFRTLPFGPGSDDEECRRASFVVAIRSMSRAGTGRGEGFEEAGVQSDVQPYLMTPDDLRSSNAGLKAAAARLLPGM